MRSFDLDNADDLDELFTAAGISYRDFSGYTIASSADPRTARIRRYTVDGAFDFGWR